MDEACEVAARFPPARLGIIEVRPVQELSTPEPGPADERAHRRPRARGGGRGLPAESRRVLATLIRLLGDFDLAEEALHEAFAAARRAVAARGRAGQPARLARLHGPLQGHRRHAPARAVRRLARRSSPSASRPRPRAPTPGEARGHRGRPAAADLHLLPPGPAAGGAGRADPARGVRPHHRGDRARLPHRAAHAGPAHRPRQGEDPRRAASRTRSRPSASCRSAWTRCCTWSTWSSTRATRPRRASR